jgi:PAS domain S-box-containing protein
MMAKKKAVVSDKDDIGWALLDAKADAVTLVDLNGTILFLNNSAAQRFGRSPEETIGICIWEIYSRACRSHHRILFNQVIQTNRPIPVTHKDKERWSQTLFFPIHGGDDQIVSIALCTWDITAQINAEERFKQVLLELITAQEDERHRISQDLHDDVGQRMTALVFQLRTMRSAVEEDQKIPLKEINTVIGNMELIIKHVRQIFYTLYPPSLNKMSLPIVLAGFCSTFEETNNVHVDFSYQEGIPGLPENYVNAIYRFVQEGLTNVSKHAKASSVWINLEYIEDDLNLSLEDNGQGFDLKQMHDGIGLHGIRQRFLMLGGSIDIESTPGKGTRLSGTIPYKTSNL